MKRTKEYWELRKVSKIDVVFEEETNYLYDAVKKGGLHHVQ